MYYKKSQKKYKNAIRLSKINKKKNFIGGKPPKIQKCDNIKELQISAMNYMENVMLCLEHVDNLLLHCQGGWAMHPDDKPHILAGWCDDINQLISTYNAISISKIKHVIPGPDTGPTIFRQILGSLKRNLLNLTIELNTFLEEINALINLDIAKSEELQTRYMAKFTCPNLPLPSINIKNKMVKHNP